MSSQETNCNLKLKKYVIPFFFCILEPFVCCSSQIKTSGNNMATLELGGNPEMILIFCYYLLHSEHRCPIMECKGTLLASWCPHIIIIHLEQCFHMIKPISLLLTLFIYLFTYFNLHKLIRLYRLHYTITSCVSLLFGAKC